MGIELKTKSVYGRKDTAKSKIATKFIGKGCPGSSTEFYRIQWGSLANCGNYSKDDIVFISTNGKRPGALPPLFSEIQKAVRACARFVTDCNHDRSRNYNIGERRVAGYLKKRGYIDREIDVDGCVISIWEKL